MTVWLVIEYGCEGDVIWRAAFDSQAKAEAARITRADDEATRIAEDIRRRPPSVGMVDLQKLTGWGEPESPDQVAQRVRKRVLEGTAIEPLEVQ